MREFFDNDFNDQQNGEYSKSSENIIQDEPMGQNENYGYGNSSFNNYSYPQKPKKENKKYGLGVVVLSVVLAALIGAGGAFAGIVIFNKTRKSSSNLPGVSDVSINVVEEASSVAQAVAEKCTKSVVGIRTTTSVMNFFGGNQQATGEGSGVIYKKDGYIITNYHVIESAVKSNGKIEVFLSGDTKKSYPATAVGYHISSDLAVLKIKPDQDLPAIELAESDNLKIGQYVVTIGAPGGLEFMGSVTYGVISGLDRVVSTTPNLKLIQTDAAINPGNSGGALLNTEGKLIGINSSKIVSEEFEGMGFAIPLKTVVEKCDNIISKQNKPEPYIGISISEKYTSEVLSYYGYPAGAVVLSVDDDSPASKAGIKRGDIITEFNGVKITEYDILGEAINDSDVGQTVEVKVYRNGNVGSVNLTVGSSS